MAISDFMGQSLRNLRANKLRTALTMLGIIWGIVAVIVLVSFGVGLKNQYYEGMTKIGRKLIFVSGGFTSSDVGGYKAGRPIRLTLKDAEAIKARCPAVEVVAPSVLGDYVVKSGTENRTIQIRGVVPESKLIRRFDIGAGRFFNQEDIRRRRRFCILGDEVRKRLFGERRDVIGQRISIKGIRFTIIGLLVRKGEQMSSFNRPDDELILVPTTTSLSLLRGSKYLWTIWTQPYSVDEATKAEQQIRRVMAELHHFAVDDKDALTIFNMPYYLKMVEMMAVALNIFLAAVSVITLFIGGVGVMNIMLVSVVERTREIGIRKSLGAKRKDILFQFMAEALIITFIGGIIGFLLGTGICMIVNQLDLPIFFPKPEFSPLVVILSIIVMVVVGVFSGTVPANQAAKLDPVEALRYE